MDIHAYLRENLHPIPTCKCYFAPDIPSRKLKGGIRVIAKSKTTAEEVVALWDDSMLETGRSGFLFTKTALFWQDNKGRNFAHIPYHEIKSAEIVDRRNPLKQIRHQLKITSEKGSWLLLEEGNDLTKLADCLNGLAAALNQTLDNLTLEELEARKAALEVRKQEISAQLEAMRDPAEEAAREKEAAAKRQAEQEKAILPAAEAFQKGTEAVESEEYAQAAKWFRQAASQEDPDAKFNLGVLYEQGLGVDADLDKAVGWYQEAAHQNCPEAQSALGMLYAQGKGVQQDLEIAKSWFQKAAAQENEEALQWLRRLEN